MLRAASRPLASVVFSAFLVAGLTTALGFVNKEARDQIPQDLVDYIPSLLSAAIVLIGANVLAQLVQTALERTMGRIGGPALRNVPNVVRIAILAFGGILAAAQLGVDTTIINIAVAALLFSIGLGAALMIGLGSRAVSGEVAAGRAVRRLVSPGDRISAGDVEGEVLDIQSVAVEVATDEGTSCSPTRTCWATASRFSGPTHPANRRPTDSGVGTSPARPAAGLRLAADGGAPT